MESKHLKFAMAPPRARQEVASSFTRLPKDHFEIEFLSRLKTRNVNRLAVLSPAIHPNGGDGDAYRHQYEPEFDHRPAQP
jgi:hypothetical protein